MSSFMSYLYNLLFGEEEKQKDSKVEESKEEVLKIYTLDPRVKNKFLHLEYPTLPRLPVIPLDEACDLYLQTVRPLCTDTEYDEAVKLIKKFKEGEGPNLRKAVELLGEESPTSYLEGIWDAGYLAFQVPTVINVSPAFGLGPIGKGRNMLQRAAEILFDATGFFDKVKNNKLPQDKERKVPLCMCQYGKLFGSTRIPAPGRDICMEYKDSKHAVVVCNNWFYKVNVYNDQGGIISEGELLNCVTKIFNDASKRNAGPPIGIFTAQERNNWAKIKANFVSVGKNKAGIEVIDSALFCVCLDFQKDYTDTTILMKAALHGEDGNRYFDKSLQFIVDKNGRACLNMEHSGFDGHTLLILCHNMWDAATKREIEEEKELSSFKGTPIEFELNDSIKKDLQGAITFHNKNCQGLSTVAVDFTDYGKKTITKVLSFSPDSFVQMAYQLTYYKIEGKSGSTYESANTKRYYHGRTECIRSVTKASVAYCKAFMDPKKTIKEKAELLRKAADVHSKNVKLAKACKTPSRIFLAMKTLAGHKKLLLPDYEYPEIFSHVSGSKMGTDMMSTSNCSGTPAVKWFAFGPTTPNCYGVGYIISGKNIHVVVTNFNGKAQKFADTLRKTFLEMREVVLKSKEE